MTDLLRNDLVSYVKDHILNHISYPHRLAYDTFDPFRTPKLHMEFRIGYNNSNNLMIVTVYFDRDNDRINIKSVVIGATIPGQQLFTIPMSSTFEKDIKDKIDYLERKMFITDTI